MCCINEKCIINQYFTLSTCDPYFLGRDMSAFVNILVYRYADNPNFRTSAPIMYFFFWDCQGTDSVTLDLDVRENADDL